MNTIQNVNPTVYQQVKERQLCDDDYNEDIEDLIDSREIFDLIRSINDPEHPLTLEQLNVVEESNIEIRDKDNYLQVMFTPTIPHCSMATLIGLSIRVKLLRSLPDRIKVMVKISPGSHASEEAVNKQLADKERVAAALENVHFLNVMNDSLSF